MIRMFSRYSARGYTLVRMGTLFTSDGSSPTYAIYRFLRRRKSKKHPKIFKSKAVLLVPFNQTELFDRQYLIPSYSSVVKGRSSNPLYERLDKSLRRDGYIQKWHWTYLLFFCEKKFGRAVIW